jgi:hypothetical protein
VSHEVPYYRTFLKTALLAGTVVVNNPFWWEVDDRFFGATLATWLGIPHPRTVALPSHSYKESVRHSLSNLVYPIPWEEHVNYLGGFPLVLRPVWDSDRPMTYHVNSLEELWRCYNQTGTACMMIQEDCTWEKYVRAFCIGQEHVVVMRCDPKANAGNRYAYDVAYLDEAQHEEVVGYALRLSQALGYDINALEFGLHEGVWYATDFANPVPDFEVNSITPDYFEWVVKTMADFAIELTRSRRSPMREFSWSKVMNAVQRSSTAERRGTATRRRGESKTTSRTSKRREEEG